MELRRTQVSPDTPPEEVARIGRTVERAGLEVTCITARGVSLRDRETFGLFRRYVDLARALGCKLMKVGGGGPLASEGGGSRGRIQDNLSREHPYKDAF